MKKIFFSFLSFFLFNAFIFADGLASLEQFKQFKNDKTIQRVSAIELKKFFDQCQEEKNTVKFEANIKNNVFIITGTISMIRRGIFTNEYIVELDVPDSLFDCSVVYPSTISQAKIQDIANLSIGDYFEALVVGRSTAAYVDILYYKLNGQTRTEL